VSTFTNHYNRYETIDKAAISFRINGRLQDVVSSREAFSLLQNRDGSACTSTPLVVANRWIRPPPPIFGQNELAREAGGTHFSPRMADVSSRHVVVAEPHP
jgi:hypothetical protein